MSGLCTSTWGSPGWFFMHSVAAGYPVDPDEYDATNGNPVGHTRRAYTVFFTSLGSVLPCRLCRDSYKKFISEIPIDRYIQSRSSLFEWVFKIHNKVNEKLGVEQEKDLQKIVHKYESFRARCPNDKKAKGCTTPAGGYKKMRCRIVIEPFNKWITLNQNQSIVFSVVIAALIIFIYQKAQRRRRLSSPSL